MARAPGIDPIDYVDPTIGGVGILLQPTRPAVYLPNSMVRVYPVMQDQLDDQIRSFPLTLVSHRQGLLFAIKAVDAAAAPETWTAPNAYDQQHATPYYYSTRYDDSLIQTEFTPAARAGYFRFSFPSGKGGVLLANHHDGQFEPKGDHVISGVENFDGMSAYVYGEFSAPVTFQPQTWDDHPGYVALAAPGSKGIEFRYGISFISVEQAQKNLAEEIPAWGFDPLKAKAREVWNQALGQVSVEGGTEAQKRVFYTALYRVDERMINITEDGSLLQWLRSQSA